MKNLLLFIFCLSSSILIAQEHLKLNFDETGTTYVKANFRAQFWTRYYQSNPNSKINKEAVDRVFDFSIRRVRFGLQSQITPKLFFYSLFGGNSYNQKTEKNFTIRILDMYAQYEFNNSFAIGIGQLGWDSPSRWTIFSNKSMLSTDALIFAMFTLNKRDNNGRSLGVFTKGQIGNFDYHFSIKSPTLFGGSDKPSLKIDYATIGSTNKRIAAYIKYEFLQNESNKTVYSGSTGTYLGKKKILNLGVGGVYQAKMMWQQKNNQTEYFDYKNWAIDLFYDSPISDKNDAITAYLGYFHSDFGPNYYRYVAPNNITESAMQGNGYPMIGTGNTIFFQTGYLFPKSEKSKLRIQPNFSVQYSNFEGLNNKVLFFDAGINFYLNGQANKISIGYQNRPVFDNQLKVSNRKGMLVVQYQVELN